MFCDENHEDNTFTKTALAWAVENKDSLCTTEIIHQEYSCHYSNRVSGVTCLRKQLSSDEHLVWTIKTLTSFYDRTSVEKYLIPFLLLTPIFISIGGYTYDAATDVTVMQEYQAKINPVTTALPELSTKCLSNQLNCSMLTASSCIDVVIAPAQYEIAFWTNLVCIVLPLIIYIIMCTNELLPQAHSYLESIGFQRTLTIVSFFGSLLLAPFYFIVAHICYKFQHDGAKEKNQFRDRLQKSEFLWGILKTTEAGIEASGQLMVQIWMLSGYASFLAEENFWGELSQKTFNGFWHFFTGAEEFEKSLGKAAISFFMLVFSISSSYRSLKRGAISYIETLFVTISIFFQALARVFSFYLFCLAARDSVAVFASFLAAHFFTVGYLKYNLEYQIKPQGFLNYILAAVSILSSSLVYVRLRPFEEQNKKPNGAIVRQQHQSTFWIQFAFFALALVENMLLALVPLVYRLNDSNRAIDCLGEARLWACFGTVFAFCVLSWAFHGLYYMCWGHPWASINGPDPCSVNLCEAEMLLQCRRSSESEEGSEENLCCCNRCLFTFKKRRADSTAFTGNVKYNGR